MTGSIKRNMDSPSSKKTLEERKLRVVVLLVMSLKLRYLYLWGISQGIVYYNGQNLHINTQNYSPWFSWVRKYLAFFMNKLPLNKVENRWLAKLTVSEGDGGYFFNSKYLLFFFHFPSVFLEIVYLFKYFLYHKKSLHIACHVLLWISIPSELKRIILRCTRGRLKKIFSWGPLERLRRSNRKQIKPHKLIIQIGSLFALKTRWFEA